MTRRTRGTIAGVEPPALGKLVPHAALTPADLAAHGGLSAANVSTGDLAAHSADDLLFERVSATRLNLSHTQFAHVQWIDCRLETCDVAGAAWEKAHLQRVELRGCRMLGVNWIGARLDHVFLQQCNATAASLWEIGCHACVFERCQCTDASFAGANLSGVIFRECDLTNANFEGATLTNTDFRGSLISELRVRPEDMRGAIVDPAQAVQLAQLFGVRVIATDDLR